MKCPSDIFDKLWAVRGSGTDNEKCIAFACEAMGEIDFTSVFRLSFDEVRVEHLKDWGNLEDWIYDLGVGLSLEDIFRHHHEDWSLGHGNYIEVVEHLSELTEADGYYSL